MTQNVPERTHVRISGHVQGVGFRWFVVRVARDAGLKGWVRNNADGSVELEAAGPPDQVAILREQVAVGPRAARVDYVMELPVSSAELPEPFDVTS